MFHGFLRTLVKVVVASLVVGTIMAHFGITPELLMKQAGLSQERVFELARKGLDWLSQPPARVADVVDLVRDLPAAAAHHPQQ